MPGLPYVAGCAWRRVSGSGQSGFRADRVFGLSRNARFVSLGLPLGHMDEFQESPASGSPRGTTSEPLPHTLQGSPVDPRDGFLLTARGNPYENVVRDGNEIIVHTAAGKDIRMQPLKQLIEQKKVSPRGVVSMQNVSKHLDRMECYTCHSSWTPQCYGCHVKIDYSQKDKCPECNESKIGFDWVAAGRTHQEPEHAADRGESEYDTIIPGKVSEQRSYLRWEEPMLGVNGEGRVTPLAPGCQPSVTIIGEDGKPVLLNHIFKTQAGAEGGGDEGQLAIDMSPTQPHTTTKNARSCESCHASQKALGSVSEARVPGTNNTSWISKRSTARSYRPVRSRRWNRSKTSTMTGHRS